ncbi:putative ABC transporter permease protein NosY [Koleobacter methoxysyntrophicus]|uniref:Putative ABC transporter permease protein NosY n=1 Tax=Koleobacter methoxysyntrophicus TaxID=2751313 RepID=A0A8A0RMN4_9FIRM|nr:ABC transporter permease subunit [Koleobacter methoxysyntrophicus]QSQ09513.1 putative ABC transporter permease protein NosY [Koleobacter methoxysyntrophicus]
MKRLAGSVMRVLYRKELIDHIRSKRFLIILFLVAVTGIASIYSAGYGIYSAVKGDENDFVFLRLFTSSGGSLPSFVSFMSFLGPLVGLSLGFDAINAERARGTLSRLLAQPIHRDTVINGKFLAGVSVIALMITSLGFAVGGLGIIMIGIPPTFEELMRILVYLIYTILYMSLWFAISLMFSLLFRQAATSALAGIALWLFLTIFIGILAGLVADGLFPINDRATIDTILRNQQTKLYISRISPSQLYDEVTVTILNPGVRTVSPILIDQLHGAIPGVMSLGQSILLVWPHLVALIAITMACFVISYVYFMRQEIRAT